MTEFDQETGEVMESQRTAMVQPQMRPLASADVTEVCAALAKAQGEFEAPAKSKKAKMQGTARSSGNEYNYEYTYAPLEEIVRVIQKPLAANGLSRQQYLVSRGDWWFVRTIIWHVSGQWISNDYPVFAEAMTAQKFAAGVTYAKRQGLCLSLGLAPEDEDDDGAQEDHKQADTRARMSTAARQAAWAEPRAERPTRGVERPQSAQQTNGHADSHQVNATSATPSPGRSDTGSTRPGWIDKFLAQDSYTIDRKNAGSWEKWADFYLKIVDYSDNVNQILKLQTDNTENREGFKNAAKAEAWKAFSDHIVQRKLTVEGIVG